MSLFQPIPNASGAADASRPLADRLRPRTLEEFVGQEHLIGPGKPLRTQVDRDDTGSLIFWGPPGTGKTTLAKIIANMTKAEFIEFSAVLAGIKEIKQVMADAERARHSGEQMTPKRTRGTSINPPASDAKKKETRRGEPAAPRARQYGTRTIV